LLVLKGYEVHGVVRRESTFKTARIDHLYRDPPGPEASLFGRFGELSDGPQHVTLIKQVNAD
jgi:GDPmannose 4,6-dehydratase